MALDPISSSSSTSTSTSSTAALNKELGKDSFLKLMVAKLRHQDPLSPTKDEDFLGQMAQFSSLEQMTNLVKATERSALSSSMTQAVGLIGKNVTYRQQADMPPVSGAVDRVTVEKGEVFLHIGSDKISASAVEAVTAETPPEPTI